MTKQHEAIWFKNVDDRKHYLWTLIITLDTLGELSTQERQEDSSMLGRIE